MGGQQSTDRTNIEGFQIASIAPESPAHEGGLIPFFDFIVGTDSVELDRTNSGDFKDYIRCNKAKPTRLHVYNTKTRSFRDVVVTPSDTWGGAGLLGCSINWESADSAQEFIWHITGVSPGSPAAAAGIQAGRDYLIGMQGITGAENVSPHITMFSDKSDFHSRMQYFTALREDVANRRNARLNQLLLLLFDSIDNSVRELMVDMQESQTLGCDVANGYLHVIPVTQGDTRLPLIRQFYVEEQPKKPGRQENFSPDLFLAPPLPAAGVAAPASPSPSSSEPLLSTLPVGSAPHQQQEQPQQQYHQVTTTDQAQSVSSLPPQGSPVALGTQPPATYNEPSWASALNTAP